MLLPNSLKPKQTVEEFARHVRSPRWGFWHWIMPTPPPAPNLKSVLQNFVSDWEGEQRAPPPPWRVWLVIFNHYVVIVHCYTAQFFDNHTSCEQPWHQHFSLLIKTCIRAVLVIKVLVKRSQLFSGPLSSWAQENLPVSSSLWVAAMHSGTFVKLDPRHSW